MSKHKVDKKVNFKAKKQIRRAVGALFLASAILVAAIPVQDIQAGPGVGSGSGQITDDRGTYSYTLENETDLTKISDTYTIDLSPSDTDTLEKSYIVRQLSDGSWSLNWQFKYYIIQASDGSERAIIGEYNSIYPETTVELSNTANVGYYTVSSTVYSQFYANGGTATAGNKDYTFSYDDYESYRGNSQYTEVMNWFTQYRKEAFFWIINAVYIHKVLI